MNVHRSDSFIDYEDGFFKYGTQIAQLWQGRENQGGDAHNNNQLGTKAHVHSAHKNIVQDARLHTQHGLHKPVEHVKRRHHPHFLDILHTKKKGEKAPRN